jgi:hypothetical protein
MLFRPCQDVVWLRTFVQKFEHSTIGHFSSGTEHLKDSAWSKNFASVLQSCRFQVQLGVLCTSIYYPIATRSFRPGYFDRSISQTYNQNGTERDQRRLQIRPSQRHPLTGRKGHLGHRRCDVFEVYDSVRLTSLSRYRRSRPRVRDSFCCS